MPSAVEMRTDFSAKQLRGLAKRSKDNRQARRLLSLAAVADGMSREEAARIGGMDRQTLRDWVHRFNALGPDGLLDVHGGGPVARLSAAQKDELAALVEAGPDFERDGLVRWRQLDVQHLIKSRFGVDYDVRYVGKLLHQMGFSHLSPRPRHPGQDAETIAAFKKTSTRRWAAI
jgi:transposase